MGINQVNAYVNFNGDAGKAIALYQNALGAKVESVMRFGDVGGDMKIAPEHKDRVMHAALHIGEGTVMLSDTMPDMPVTTKGNVQITLHFTDVTDMAKKFDALAAGGTVTMALQDTFWGARFGMLTDAFGVQWMFNCDLKKG
jgi:PhnB protein